MTVDEVIVAFVRFAEEHYRTADGKPSAAFLEYKVALRPLHALYGHPRAADFVPLALKAVRGKLAESGAVCRKTVNARAGKVKRVFKWAASEQLVPAAVFQSLETVEGLRAGRGSPKDHEPVEPVADALVNATLPRLNRHVAGLVRFQRLTGCRPSEATGVKRCDIDTSGAVWLYRPRTHKTAHRGKTRVIAIGPKAQNLLREFFTDDPNDYLFSPKRAVEEFRTGSAAKRKSPNYGALRIVLVHRQCSRE